MPDSTRWKRLLIAVLVLAFCLRAGAAVALQSQLDHVPNRDFLIEGDAGGYWSLAHQLAAGEAFEIYDPPRRVSRMPGFPWLLSLGMRLFAENMLMMRLLLSVVGTVACYLVFRLGRILVDPQTGVLAAGLAAISPAFVGFTPLILSETLFAATLVLSLVALAKFVQRRQPPQVLRRQIGWAFLSGILIGIATLVRPSWMLIAPGFAVLFWWFGDRSSRGAALAMLIIVGLVGVLTPWTIRNYRVTGHFVPTSLWVGPSLYDGLNPQATGSSDMEFVEADGIYERMSEYDADQHYRKAAWDFAVSNPGRALQLSGMKLARYWSPWPNAAQFRRWELAVPLAAFFLLVFSTAIIGFWLSRHDWWLCLLTVGPVFYFSCIHALFVGSIRYRLPAEYPLMVLAAVGLRHVWQKFHGEI